MSECRFCKRSGVRFVKAHIIPRSFFKIVRGKGKFAVEMQAKHDKLETPYHQAGVMDPAMLCDECEPKFGEWDTYGYEVLSTPRDPADALRFSGTGVPMAFELKKLNYEIFALFVLSVLWRASESTVSFYRGVQLGPYADHLREALWRRQAPPPADHAIQLGTSLDHPYKNTILQPDFCRHDGRRFYRLFFPNVFALVKMDQQQAEPLMLLGMLQPRETNYMLCYPYAQSPYSRFFEGMKKRMGELRRSGRIRD